MKKTSKLLVLILVLVLSLSVVMLAACNKDSENKTETPTGKVAIDRLSNLSLLVEQDDKMINTYTMIAVDGDGAGFGANPVTLNEAGADAFIKWMSLASTRTLIAGYGVENYGDSLFYLLDSAPIYTGAVEKATDATKTIKISTTTSVNDSKLMQYIVPKFEEEYGYDVDIVSAGTGAAIQVAKDGDADLILVHSKKQEEPFAESYGRTVDGCGTSKRISFMYNYFVLVGPTADPAGAKAASIADGKTVADGFAAIAAKGSKFVSRGDNSGTHTKETDLWKASGITLTTITISYKSKGVTKTETGFDAPAVSSTDSTLAAWYYSAGQGMGVCLLMANELNGYCLTDKATFLTYKYWVEE